VETSLWLAEVPSVLLFGKTGTGGGIESALYADSLFSLPPGNCCIGNMPPAFMLLKSGKFIPP